jgi:hypothetical protein
MPKLPAKIDKRTKNGKKLDIMQVIKLRDVQNLSFGQIASIVGYTTQYVNSAYRKFKELLPGHEILETYESNRAAILSGMELNLLDKLNDEDKLKKASLNNVAFAYTQIHNAKRLASGESTSNIGIKVEAKLARALDKSKLTDDTINMEGSN